jgi:primosomal protein N' (replication factor Y) (superfamily II helicase)
MGVDRPGGRAGGRGRPLTAPAARVVPEVASFQVDQGFWYRVPPHLSLSVGSIVRVPLGGRRVAGFTVELAERPTEGLRDVAAVTGSAPVFDRPHLEVLGRVAQHYLTPLAGVLRRSAPPNAPRSLPALEPGRAGSPPPAPDLARYAEALASGRRVHPLYLLERPASFSRLAELVGAAVTRGSALVVVPTGSELVPVVRVLDRALPGRVVAVHPDDDAATTTAAWGRMAGGSGLVLVGTARVALWHIPGLRLCAAVEEGRRAMKERSTPTIHVREVLRMRSARTGAGLVFCGPTPTVEALAIGPDVLPPRDRLRCWPLVEIVDRSEEPPSAGVVGERARTAIRTAVARGDQVFVFSHRHGYAPAHRCVACRAVRRCESCGSRPDPGPVCRRCGAELGPCTTCRGVRFEPLGAGEERVAEELRRVVDPNQVGGAGSGAPVRVGTERDLASLEPVDLAVVVDADGLVYGTNYRSGEEALRILARVAGRVRTGRGRRMLVQTSSPADPVIAALRRGEPLEYLRLELERRVAFGFPPAADLMVLETRGEVPTADEDLRAAVESDVEVLGPAPSPRGSRWLIRGSDLDRTRTALRPVVQRWRDSGASVRVDVDPIDL